MKRSGWADAERRLAELAERHELPSGATARLRAYLELLARAEHAPTPIREPSQAVDSHLADSLAALALPEVEQAARACDLGAGPGLPGLALAIARPSLHMALVESAARKAAFLRAALAATATTNATVVHDRAESWVQGRDAHDLVCARALAPLAVVVEYAAPLLRPEGALVAWKGAPAREEVRDGDAAAAALGLRLDRVEAARPFAGADRRTLYVYVKLSPTPPGYPRRPGMARKRPIRASGRG